MTPEEVAAAIMHSFPDWRVDSIHYLSEGDDCAAYVVNEEWLFRVAKHAQAREGLRREYCLLPGLAAAFTLQIPAPRLAALDGQTEWPFVGYRLLPGPALTRERYLSLDEGDRQRAAAAVARFLNQLHAVDLEPARQCGVSVVNYTELYAGVLAQARAQLYTALDEPERRFIERLFTSYLESGDPEAFEPALLHGDLSPEHVLFDEPSRSVSAVIDFGDMMIGDPAWDLVLIYEDYGLDFLGRLLPAYGGNDQAALLGRLYQYYLMNAVEWTIGERSHAAAEFAEALAQLRRLRVQEAASRKELLSFCGGGR